MSTCYTLGCSLAPVDPFGRQGHPESSERVQELEPSPATDGTEAKDDAGFGRRQHRLRRAGNELSQSEVQDYDHFETNTVDH